ncbi:helix-turn-helix transcriptional regulator [Salinispira pacifica]
MAKSDSLLSILWLLRSRGRMTALELAGELEVDVRTIYRYIDSLSVSGAPIVAESGPNGGYTLLETFRETPLFFTRPERVALAHASMFARRAGYPYSDALELALRKMEQHMSPAQLDNLHTHVSGLEVIDTGSTDVYSMGEDSTSEGAPRPADVMEQRLRIMEEAVAEGRRLAISHRREISGGPVGREVDPYGLIYWRDNWYLVGYCHLRRDIRMFRCDKILSVDDTGVRFERRAGFSARRYFLQQMIPEGSFTSTVTVRLSGTPNAVDHLSRHWYYRHFIRDRSLRTLGLAISEEEAVEFLPDVIVSYGTSMRVLEPEQLRRAVEELAAAIVEMYRNERQARGGEG